MQTMNTKDYLPSSENQYESGAILIVITVLLMVFLAFTALAVDIGYLYVIRNELQNAADAGALAGARRLYVDDGSQIDPAANQVASDTAIANFSMNIAVEVQDPLSNNGDVQRGHWSFATETFTPNDSLAPVNLWGVTTAELDANTDFINAVRVLVRREAIPAKSFFSNLLGYDSFAVGAEAIAYIGFVGGTDEDQVDLPIAICQESIQSGPDGGYDCATGRMLNSSGSTTTNTGGWSNFSQEPCETASVPTVRPYTSCGPTDTPALKFDVGMGTVGGVQDTIYRDVRDCWLVSAPSYLPDPSGDPIPNGFWNATLPVIECPGNNVGNCAVLVGAVNVNVVWIKQSGADPNWLDIPLVMEDWTCAHYGPTVTTDELTLEQRIECWQSFTSHFGLHTWDDVEVGTLSSSDILKTIFFAPDCSFHDPQGLTGGKNFGILAEIPVLVD
jgi:Flp pilus assembly protein TadG